MGKYIRNKNRKKNVMLILSPHPDDLELSTSILCTKFKKKYEIIEIVLTDGSIGGINSKDFNSKNHIEKRKNESILSAKILGIKKILFLNYKDGKLIKNIERAKIKISKIIQKYDIKILCFPGSKDEHKDHIATNYIGQYILRQNKEIIDLQYCFWGKNNNDNIKISLLKSSYLKKEALSQHKSQPIQKYIEEHKKILREESFFSKKIQTIKAL